MTTDRAAAPRADAYEDELPFDDPTAFAAAAADAAAYEDELYELSPPGVDLPCADRPVGAPPPASDEHRSSPIDSDCVEDLAADADTDPAIDGDGDGAEQAEPVVEIRPSARRKRTVTAYREGNRTVVLVPARMSRREQERHAAELVARLDRRESRNRPSDADLHRRARALSRRWLDGRAKPASVRWVDNQRSRWGSCTPVDASIRLSSRLQGMPDYVVDAVLLHELAHLLEPNHSPEFWALLTPFPDHERANAYLDGVAFGAAHLREN
jgi:hypothetical protein